MARPTETQMIERRRQIEVLDLKGHTPSSIAEAIGSDIRTVKSVLAQIAVERSKDLDLNAERLRLLAELREITATAWQVWAQLPPKDQLGKLGVLGKLLQAGERREKVLGAITALDTDRRIAQLERTLEEVREALSGA